MPKGRTKACDRAGGFSCRPSACSKAFCALQPNQILGKASYPGGQTLPTRHHPLPLQHHAPVVPVGGSRSRPNLLRSDLCVFPFSRLLPWYAGANYPPVRAAAIAGAESSFDLKLVAGLVATADARGGSPGAASSFAAFSRRFIGCGSPQRARGTNCGAMQLPERAKILCKATKKQTPGTQRSLQTGSKIRFEDSHCQCHRIEARRHDADLARKDSWETMKMPSSGPTQPYLQARQL